jgi:phospholipid/cholesterol/gamma-HCH transport system substrate-binding protein
MMTNRLGGSGATVADRERTQELLRAAPRPSARREVRVGLFVLVGAAMVVFALFTLTDVTAMRNRYMVTTTVPDAAGIRRGDPVQMLGVNIGRVRGFDIAASGVAVRLELQKEYPVPTDSRVVLSSGGLLGGTVAEVVPGTSPQSLRAGGILAGSSGGPGLMDTAGDIGVRADDVLLRVQTVLSEQTVGAVGTSAVELQRMLTEMSALAAQQRQELASLTASLRRSAAGVENAATAPELAASIARLDGMTQRLDATIGSMNRTSGSLEAVIARMERGEGTLGRLSRDDELYRNLNDAAQNLNLLATDIRENPRRYINVRVF